MTTSIEIKAVDVQKLRQTTGAGLMDCKKALADAGGDMEKAVKLLRERGIAKSSKRLDRVAGEGLVDAWIREDSQEGILLEMNCETDFVARNQEFISLHKKVLDQIMANPTWTTIDQVPKEEILALSGKIGEKIEVRRFTRLQTANGIISSYIHAGSKLGVLLRIDSKKAGAPSDVFKELARELALQIAGANPTYVSRKDVPADVLEREKDITKKQMEGQNKPADIMEKIAIGKLGQFYAVQCLLDQPYVRDATGKTTIQQLIDTAAKKDATEFNVVQFARFRVGAD